MQHDFYWINIQNMTYTVEEIIFSYKKFDSAKDYQEMMLY